MQLTDTQVGDRKRLVELCGKLEYWWGWFHRGSKPGKYDIYYKYVWSNEGFIDKSPVLGRKLCSLTKKKIFFHI